MKIWQIVPLAVLTAGFGMTTGVLAAEKGAMTSHGHGVSETKMDQNMSQQRSQNMEKIKVQNKNQVSTMNMSQAGTAETFDRVKGIRVQNREGQQLGTIDNLMVDLDQGRLAYAVVSSGGVMGMGEETFIVPWDALRFNADKTILTLQGNQNGLMQAPKENMNVLNRQKGQEIYQFYGVAPYWEENQLENRE